MTISNTFCYDLVGLWTWQSFIMCLIGPLLSMMSCCMFCGIRCPYKEKERVFDYKEEIVEETPLYYYMKDNCRVTLDNQAELLDINMNLVDRNGHIDATKNLIDFRADH